MTVLRHAALQRHVGMNAQPVPVGMTRENDCRPSWPVEATAVSVEARARPGRDYCRHPAIGAGQHFRVLQVESKIRGAGPDVVPLRLCPA